jgi:Icc-related predicted phosphoesterase
MLFLFLEMRLLLFVDFHGNMRLFDALKKKSRMADMLVCAGDISQMGNNLHMILSKFDSLNKHMYIVHGNHESPDEMREACEDLGNVTFLHRAVNINGEHTFLGYGGGGFSQTDTEFQVVADNFFKKHDLSKSILITHAPPYKTKVDLVHGEHVGNKSIRKFIDTAQPSLVVTGHLHENFGRTDIIGRTRIINPGNEGVIVQI